MMNNRAELLVNIARRAPWLLEGNEAFFPEIVCRNTLQLIDEIKDTQVTIISDTGKVYQQKLAVGIRNNELKIAKPTNWEEASDTFHLFFRPLDKRWHFFRINDAISYPSVFSAPIPDTVYTLQKRRHRRISSSGSMGVIFRNSANILNNAHIKDISAGGMLICENFPPDRYPMDSQISDIFISVNTHCGKDDDRLSRKIWPLISKGRIVRSTFDRESELGYYGVMFMHESSYVKETLNMLIDGMGGRQ